MTSCCCQKVSNLPGTHVSHGLFAWYHISISVIAYMSASLLQPDQEVDVFGIKRCSARLFTHLGACYLALQNLQHAVCALLLMQLW